MSAHRFYVDLPHGQMHGRIAVTPGAPWLVLLHQSPSSSAMFDALIPLLAPRFNVIAPDNPGFGQSDPLEQVSVEAIADAVAMTLAAHGISRASVFGHHTGAAIGVALANGRPELVERLAVCGPPVLSAERRAALPEMAPVEEPMPDGSHFVAMWARLRAKEVSAPPALSTRETGLAFASAAYTRATYQAVADYDFSAALQALSQPVLMFAGTRDSLAACLPDAARLRPDDPCISIPDAGGYVCELKPDLVADLLTGFFLGQADGS